MHKRLLLYPIIAGLLVLMATLPTAAAQFSPAVFVVDQDVVDAMVRVTRVTANAPGWMVIHADEGGAPGPVLGQSAVGSGITADVVVEIDTSGITDTLWAMLHVDEGVVGEYEFPGADVPVVINDAIVMDSFAVGDVAQSIAGIAVANEGFSTLVQALDAAGLVETLQSDGPFTVFAPTNDAFAAVPAETLDGLFADPEALAQVLLYHVIPGTVPAADVTDGMEAETAQGDTVTFAVGEDGTVTINEATVTDTDLVAYNGIIHVIDQVLLPPAPAEEEAAAASAEEEEVPTPVVAVADQESDGTTVTVDSVVAAQDGWLVIHLDDNGAPGPVLGQTAVVAGETTAVTVSLDEPLSAETALWAMLHVDEGDAGVYEFPGPDGPVLVDDEIVMAPFTAMVAEMADEAVTETEVMTETVEMTDAAMMGETPSVTVIDQGSTGVNVAVIQAVAAQAGWLVIHADNNGAPGAVLGQASLPAGTTDNIIVTLDEPISGETRLWAMLHVDEGEAGVYEFPGVDGPVTLDGEVVMQSFTAIVTGAEAVATPVPAEEPAATAVPAEEPAATAVPAEEPAATAVPAEEAMADDAVAAPDLLPQTGFATGSAGSQLPVIFLVMVALFGTALIARRRGR